MHLSETIRLFMDSIGRSDEYEFYLKKFNSNESSLFSIICPDFDSLSQAASIIRLNLNFLLRLNLCPVVLLCGVRVNEMRILLTGDAADRVSHHFLFLIRDQLQGAPHRLQDIIRNALKTTQSENAYLLLGIETSLPIALEKIASLLSNRFLFLRMKGALKNLSNEDISIYRIRENKPLLLPADKIMKEMAAGLLNGGMDHIAVASPYRMLKEIFTVRGAGTIIRTGSNILVFKNRREVDETRLLSLLEESFKCKLNKEALNRPISYYYIEENYKGALLLEEHSFGCYISKFAVGTQARGDGVAQELWDIASAKHPEIFWRASRENSVIRWYKRIADGYQHGAKWNVYWSGIEMSDIPAVIKFTLQQPDDFSFSQKEDASESGEKILK